MAMLGSGIPTAGRILGSILTPFIADRIGRRWCMLAMSLMFIVAVIVEVTANSFWQIVIGMTSSLIHPFSSIDLKGRAISQLYSHGNSRCFGSGLSI
jgi:MFS family permease